MSKLNLTQKRHTLRAGWNVLAGADRERILSAVGQPAPEASGHRQLYGDGRASVRIVKWLEGSEGSS